MAKLGRPKSKTPRENIVSTYLEDALYKSFAKRCDLEERAMSQQIRLLVKAWVNGER